MAGTQEHTIFKCPLSWGINDFPRRFDKLLSTFQKIKKDHKGYKLETHTGNWEGAFNFEIHATRPETNAERKARQKTEALKIAAIKARIERQKLNYKIEERATYERLKKKYEAKP